MVWILDDTKSLGVSISEEPTYPPEEKKFPWLLLISIGGFIYKYGT